MHEEIFERIALGKVIEQVKPDFVVIGEASELNLKIGQRGRAEVSVQVKGRRPIRPIPGWESMPFIR